MLLEVERGKDSVDVVGLLIEAFRTRGVPRHIRRDNDGPRLTIASVTSESSSVNSSVKMAA